MSSPTQPTSTAATTLDSHRSDDVFPCTPTILAGRGTPPEQVLAQMARADEVFMELAARGQRLTLTEDGTRFELRGPGRELLGTLTLAEAAELAMDR